MADNDGLLDAYVTEKQVAEELAVSVRTLKRWGMGRIFFTIGRRKFTTRAQVKKWLEDQKPC